MLKACSIMPRDSLTDSLAAMRIVENDDEDILPTENKFSCIQYKKHHTRKSTDRRASNKEQSTKDDCACYYNYGLGEGSNHVHDAVYQYKTNSLPAASSINQDWDYVICSALRIHPDDIASQLTLLDLPCFKAIRPDELLTCGWTKLNKVNVAPNVVAFTKRFNRVSFWTVQEILNEQSPKARAEAIAHFIKVSKKLHELNNLHSLFAVISALQSASIFRLNKTWACLSKKDKQQFDKLTEIFCEKGNWSALREYLRNISLPCIPFLGIFLTDLVYIDIAHPTGSPHRLTKMSVVLKTLETYQTSKYDTPPLPQVANYLNSVRYIEELQKFLEDDQYKLSLKLEPSSPVGSSIGSKESMKDCSSQAGALNGFNASPNHRLNTGSVRIHGAQTKFIPTHRKCRSLGSKFRSASLPRNFHKVNFGVGIFGKGHTEDQIDDKTPAGSVNLLDDTLLESPESSTDDNMSSHRNCSFMMGLRSRSLECAVKRKTIAKNAKRRSYSTWHRYWIELRGPMLYYFAPRSFMGSYRDCFKETSYKSLLVIGWNASLDGVGFQLTNYQIGTTYKFKTKNITIAEAWVDQLERAATQRENTFPANLMTFE